MAETSNSPRLPEVETIVDLLEYRSRRAPDDIAYVFLPNGEVGEENIQISYSDLLRRARQLSGRLATVGTTPGAVLLLLPPGIDYLVAFFACLCAGAVAVPAYPPSGRRDDQRIRSILDDSAPAVVIADGPTLQRTRLLDAGSASRTWLDIHAELPPNAVWRRPAIGRHDIAFLQYTSGSTSAPKGVVLTHGNLLHNLDATYSLLGCSEATRVVSWLPPYHDMGLIGGILQPLFCGTPGVLMPPATFIQRPYRWLKAISHFRATSSPAPNFAYDLCVRKVTPEQRRTLDLSSWASAINGAEPVRSETLEAFVQAFEPCGFRRASFFPAYGLAEATLLVSAAGGAGTLAVSKEALARNEVASADASAADALRLVGCGRMLPDQSVRIVDPVSCEACAPGRVGEIWVSGPSIAQGYHGDHAASERTFGACIAGEGPRTYLRTGDLGFIHDQQLYVTGRHKDLIIVHGHNLYPQDIEAVVEASHEALRAHACAAFVLEADEGAEPSLVVVQELEFRSRAEPAEVIAAIRRAVAGFVDVPLAAVALVKPGSIPMTSSGKIQRRATRRLFLEGQLKLVGEWRNERLFARGQGGAPAVPAPAGGQRSEADIRQWLLARIAAEAGLDVQCIDADVPFSENGLHSVKLLSMLGELNEWLGAGIDPTLAWEHPTPAALARFLAGNPAPDRLTEMSLPAVDARASIAIVGIGCRVPGADSPQEFWSLLRDGRQITPRDTEAGLPRARRPGAFLSSIDRFDAGFFGIAPREADAMDPQQRLLLEVSWEALENAGIAADRLAGSRTGVFVGISGSDYSLLAFDPRREASAYSATGNAHSIAANRLSYLLDLRGPSLAVDTACSSSLVAVHLACQSLRRGESRLAIAAGVNLVLDDAVHETFRTARMLSPDGRCKTFDAAADGYARGEGCAAIVLKPLADALADGDTIHAVIRGTAINQDGRSNGLTAPNGQAQQAVIRAALADAGVEGAQIGYVEAHGTGTPLGDPIELKALQAALGAETGGRCHVGSVKTNIGHLEAAAGITGLIKACLALAHGEIPPHRHLAALNPRITLAERFAIPTQAVPWPAAAPRFAGVSSFGFGGTNAHVVLEAASSSWAAPQRDGAHVYTLSAKSPAALAALVERHAAWMEREAPALADACYTSNVGRSHFEHRRAVVASSIEELKQGLANLRTELTGAASDGEEPPRRSPRVAFVYTGQGSQYPGMTLALHAQEPVFREAVDECEAILLAEHGLSVLALLQAGEAIHDTRHAQVAIFVCQYGLTRLWRAWGAQPAAVMGHSLGEYAAACAAGCLSLKTALALVMQRALLMGGLPSGGAMASVPGDAPAVEAMLREAGVSLEIAALNGAACVVSGAADEIDRLVAHLGRRGVETQRLAVSHAFHSRLMDPVLDTFESAASRFEYLAPRLPLVSNLTGALMADGQVPDAAYWRCHLREPVRFADGVRTLAEAGCEVFLEIGPHPVLAGMVRQILPAGAAAPVASLRRNVADTHALRLALAHLYAHGCEIDWEAVHAPARGRRVALPTYPFSRASHWLAPLPDIHARDSSEAMLDALRTSLAQGAGMPPGALLEASSPRQALLETLSLACIARTLGQWMTGCGRFTADDVFLRGQAAPRYHRAIRVWLDALVQAGQLSHDGASYAGLRVPADANLQALEAGALEAWSDMPGLVEFVARTGDALAEIVAGRTNPLEILFPGGSFAIAEQLYRDSPHAQFYNRTIAGVVQAFAQARGGAALSVLEIGAGTGSTTAAVLPVLGDGARYEFTDISEAFISHARIRFERYPFVRYRTLDIDSELQPQGFGGQRYDVVIAANVLHAVRDLPAALKRVRSLLAPGGLLVMWELTTPQAWFDLTFGLLIPAMGPADPRGAQPLQAGAAWRALLAEAGFGATLLLPQAEPDAAEPAQHVIVALQRVAAALPVAGPASRPHLLLADPVDLPGQRAFAFVPDAAWLRDHQVQGREVVPAAAMAEAAWAAVGQQVLPGGMAVCLEDLRFLRMLGAAGEPARLVVDAREARGRFVLARQDETGAWTEHASGHWSLVPLEGGQAEVSFEAACSGCTHEADPVALYQRFETEGLSYGPAFQGICRLSTGEGEALAWIELPEALAPEAAAYRCHPVLLDACFQAVAAALPEPDAAGPMVPVAIGALNLLAPVGRRCWAHAKLRQGHSSGEPGAVADLSVFDEQGRCVALVQGFRVAPLAPRMLVERPELQYTLGWQAVDAAEPGTDPLAGWPQARWLLVGDATLEGCASRLRAFGHEVVQADVAQACADAAARFDHVLYLGTAGAALPACTDFMRLFQSACCESARLWLLTLGAQAVDGTERLVDPVQAALWGMGRVAAGEAPQRWGGLVDLDPAEPGADPFAAMAFLSQQVGEHGVALRGGRLHVPRLRRVAAEPSAAPAMQLRTDATYLISGGLGGLGLLLAGKLAADGARRLVLATRRSVPPRAAWKQVDPASALGRQLAEVIAIERLGVHVRVECCDVSDEATLAALLGRLDDEQWPPVRGVIHAAMDLENQALSQLDLAGLARVLRPKVDGALALHRCLAPQPLDFMLLFSSVAALFGSPGQSAYAAANAFLDAFAARCRQQGDKVWSIAWGPWAEVGWVARHGAQAQLAQAGIGLLDPGQALELLARLGAGAPAYLAVAAVDWPAFAQAHRAGAPLDFIGPLLAQSAGGESGRLALADAALPARALLLQQEASERTAAVADGLRRLVGRVMQLAPEAVDPRRSLNLQGLDSLMAVELKNAAERWLGVSIPMAMLVDNATVESLGRHLAEQLDSAAPAEALEILVPDEAGRHEPFPLNDIQQAYWLGRTDAFALGGVGTHIYLEFEGEAVDIARLEASWNELVARHEMLRCVVLSSGEQQILREVPRYRIAVSGAEAAEATREQMSHQVFDAGMWPLFDIRITLLAEGRTRLHLSLDLMIADAASILILLTEWGQLYQGARPLPAIGLSFRDYLLAERRLESSARHRQAQQYWRERVHTLPPGPALPLALNPQEVQNPRFSRVELRLEADAWARLKAGAAARGITPSMLVCAAYARTLARWSKTAHFTLNVTLFNRQPLHPDVNRLVGDFTSVNLLELAVAPGEGLAATAEKAQKQLWRDLEHRSVSGIAVLRELTRVRGAQVTMPVVFTSNLEDTRHLGWLGKVVHGISQTPQVWLDHQVLEQDGQLLCSWDYVESLFPAGLVEDMFDSFRALLLQLVDGDDAAWHDAALPKLPEGQRALLSAVNDTAWAAPPCLLHEPFVAQARRCPDAVALVSSTMTLSYGELLHGARTVAAWLAGRGVRPNQLVAVAMEKGWEQTVAVLGILMAGAAYLPIDAHLPIERQNHLIQVGEARQLLTQPRYRGSAWPGEAELLCIDGGVFEAPTAADLPLPPASRTDLAYVIFTSGSTGLPKGVMIDHRGAVNTVLDLNERIGLSASDRVLALSNLNFDLSVYDIFGTLAAGGTIVVPDAELERDPAYLARLVEQQRVSVWNSVPALLGLYADQLALQPPAGPLALRIAMLSGDWIPLALPGQIQARVPGIEVLSLGGATEASIWSIAYPVSRVEPGWKSIPYGKALHNQAMLVLNEAMEPCPLWVTGHIHIGGIGLAQGYWRDEGKTAASFLTHPRTGERLYRTGDLGRWLPDGNIEFLGREDFQVKIQGYRIELGEIEAALNQHADVADSIVLTVGERQEGKRLAAFVVGRGDGLLEAEALRAFLRQKLPDYMVPPTFEQLDAFPLTANGKVDRKALASRVTLAPAQALVAPRTDTEEALALLVQRTLGLEAVGVETNFFEMGFDSLQGTALVTAIRQSFDIDLPLRAFFEAPTIARLGQVIENLILAEIEQLTDEQALQQVQDMARVSTELA